MSWQESLRAHVRSLEHMMGRVDPDEVAVALRLMDECRGLIIFAGIGQNLMLANKAASTYNSLSLRSISVDPVASLHGTMGMFRPDDLLVLLSKSGETAELLRFVDACHRTGHTRILGVHSAPGCELAGRSMHSVFIPLEAEADHLGLAPTASSVCLLAFLHALAVELAGRRGLTAADFVRTHPGGTIGSRLGAGA
ncbi:MAG TPA: SIS domain-containing protein [Micromonosporaceae bacterium]